MEGEVLFRKFLRELRAEIGWVPDLIDGAASLQYDEDISEMRLVFTKSLNYGYYQTKKHESLVQEVASRVVGKPVVLKVLRVSPV